MQGETRREEKEKEENIRRRKIYFLQRRRKTRKRGIFFRGEEKRRGKIFGEGKLLQTGRDGRTSKALKQEKEVQIITFGIGCELLQRKLMSKTNPHVAKFRLKSECFQFCSKEAGASTWCETLLKIQLGFVWRRARNSCYMLDKFCAKFSLVRIGKARQWSDAGLMRM